MLNIFFSFKLFLFLKAIILCKSLRSHSKTTQHFNVKSGPQKVFEALGLEVHRSVFSYLQNRLLLFRREHRATI